MSSPTQRGDTNDLVSEAPSSLYVVVKFNTGAVNTGAVDEGTLESLYNPEHQFSTGDADLERLVDSLPPVLNWQQIFETFHGENSVSFGPLSTTLSWDQLKQLNQEARETREQDKELDQKRDLGLDEDDRYSRGEEPPAPALHAFFRFDLDAAHEDDEVLLNRLVALIRASDHTVATAYLARDAALPPRSRTAYLQPSNMVLSQGYFADSADSGMSIASFLGEHPEADGRGIRLADVEQGWFTDHPDLPTIDGWSLLSGENVAVRGRHPDPVHARQVGLHGMMVLGIIVAKRDGRGVNGIAPGTEIELASELVYRVWDGKYVGNLYSAITSATYWLRKGDVLLIEAQQKPPTITDNGVERTGFNVPVEIRQDIFEAIQTATWKGITVIEPTGNNVLANGQGNGISLDEITAELEDGSTSTLFKWDSGSVLVAAGSNLEDRANFTRLSSSNHSQYTNSFADGDYLWVLDPPSAAYSTTPLTPSQLNDLYEQIKRGGTSSAAAIIAAVAVLLQSLAKSKGRVITPDIMRQLLSSRVLSSQDRKAAGIGVMPDLVKIINRFPNLTAVSDPRR